MKIALNRDEKGQALILVLILLLLAGVIITSLLGFMGTGLKSGQVFEKKMDQLYAADAGIEDAIWHLQRREPVPKLEPLNSESVKSVEVTVVDKTVEEDEQRTYLITSTATSEDGSGTTINSYVSIYQRYLIFDYGITSNSLLTGHNIVVKGSIYAYDDISLSGPSTHITGDAYSAIGTVSGREYVEGDVVEGVEPIEFPTIDADELASQCEAEARAGGNIVSGDTIDTSSFTEDNPCPIGPLYVAGNLTIHKKGVARLEGTIYVEDDLSIGPDCTIILNKNTIFVEGNINMNSSASFVKSGNIIAMGDINFAHATTSDPDDFIFIMSTAGSITCSSLIKTGALIYAPAPEPEGEVTLSHGISVTGCVVGREVIVNAGCNITYREPPEGWEMLGAGEAEVRVAIHTWKIS